tara:strand:+ start:502 stop:654 length:153 start_codon:yes stop_codon:yes gene_type:complete
LTSLVYRKDNMEDNTYIDDIMIDEYLDTFPSVWEEVIIISIDDLIESRLR